MIWVLVVGAGWLVVGAVVAVIVGRSIRLADGKARGQKAAAARAALHEPNFVVDQPVAGPGPSTVPSLDAQVIDLHAPRDTRAVRPARPPAVGDGARPAAPEPLRREHGLA